MDHNQQQLREDLSVPEVLDVIHVKTQNQLRDFQQYFLPSMKALHEEFRDDICHDQQEAMSEREKTMFDIAVRAENDLLDENAEWIPEQPVTFNYFGVPIAYSEDDRQWIDYHMAQGNIEAALNIHRAYLKD